MPKLEVSLTNETAWRVDKKELVDTLEIILLRLNHLGKVSIELLLVGDEKIKTLNKKFRGIDKPTDVLSFATENMEPDFIGSIVVSVPTAKKQAKHANIQLQKEVNTLAGHGLLHLLGYDHR